MTLEAYCLKCKTKREIQDPQPALTTRGAPATRGTCPVCGTTLNRLGATEAHEGLERPKSQPKVRRKGVGKGKGGGKAQKGRRAGTAATRRNGRGGKLVIVESPAKARTVGKFLGAGYLVKASLGHVRDLLRSRLSVDVERDFEPTYRVPNEKREVVKELTEAVRRASELYLATDPDREGEAIAWHVLETVRTDGTPPAKRVVFHEITREAIERSFSHPRPINMKLVDAQQARRILDRLVGYKVSPLLWEKVKSGLSAGRVQTVALRLVVDREKEIRAFVPEEYWLIGVELEKRDTSEAFTARLTRIDGREAEIKNEGQAQAAVRGLERARYFVEQVERKERRRHPWPPFITSTLQQEASHRLGFRASRTMRIAQQLYEGVRQGREGEQGLITYLRTDSVHVSSGSRFAARDYVEREFGREYVPEKPRVYRTRSKSAQEAHEAIRPTSVARYPDRIKGYLSRDQYKLYRLIWQRFVASQMASAVLDQVAIDLATRPANGQGSFGLRATGSRLGFPGYLAVYGRGEGERDIELPLLTEGEEVDLRQVLPEQKFTQPAARYSEATLVKVLEEEGIGRPSTYAPILSTILDRGYVEFLQKSLKPTGLGEVVVDLLVEHFPKVFAVDFTARMEDELDAIAKGKDTLVGVLRDFYQPFSETLQVARKEMDKVELEQELTGESCPECGHPLATKHGRYGKFIACTHFPECRFTKPLLQKVGVKCPQCGAGELVKRYTRKRRVFYGCWRYPACDFSVWRKPLPEPCPNCGGLLIQSARGRAKCTVCGQTAPLPKVKELERETA